MKPLGAEPPPPRKRRKGSQPPSVRAFVVLARQTNQPGVVKATPVTGSLVPSRFGGGGRYGGNRPGQRAGAGSRAGSEGSVLCRRLQVAREEHGRRSAAPPGKAATTLGGGGSSEAEGGTGRGDDVRVVARQLRAQGPPASNSSVIPGGGLRAAGDDNHVGEGDVVPARVRVGRIRCRLCSLQETSTTPPPPAIFRLVPDRRRADTVSRRRPSKDARGWR